MDSSFLTQKVFVKFQLGYPQWGRKNLWLLTNNSLYLVNSMHRLYERRIGSHMCSIEQWYCWCIWVTQIAPNRPQLLRLGSSFISLEWLKLESSNFVHRQAISVVSLWGVRLLPNGRGRARMTHFEILGPPSYLWNRWNSALNFVCRLVRVSTSALPLKRCV